MFEASTKFLSLNIVLVCVCSRVEHGAQASGPGLSFPISFFPRPHESTVNEEGSNMKSVLSDTAAGDSSAAETRNFRQKNERLENGSRLRLIEEGGKNEERSLFIHPPAFCCMCF